ncbi:RNHCP domain-containing protein [Streptomyces sp. HD1123-B1]|uniref:RNHCP domain-containing protein n=1 Tax=Streptomyces huangiella TaxID=3228804 RepID=UPI003D7EE874
MKTPFDSPRSSTISRRTTENTGFTCAYCGRAVVALANGGYRNHCPYCLHSLHVDISPGDRANDCRALMRPVAVEHHSAKGYMIVHQCTGCGTRGRNRMADDPHHGDDLDTVLALMHPAVRDHEAAHRRRRTL